MKKILQVFLTVIAAALLLAACGPAVGEGSPKLQNASIRACCEGGEDSQFVQAVLEFDRAVSIPQKPEDSLRITIAGNRVRSYTLEPGETGNTVVVTIPVNAITEGVLYIGRNPESDAVTDIRSQDGSYAAAEFELEGIIPSGVTLSTAESGPGSVTKTVESPYTIRSIAWVGLYEDGVLVPVSETRTGETLDGHAAAHGHEFLIEDEESIAAMITELLQNNYGEAYSFTCDGSRITARKEGSAASLDICIYQYLQIDGQRQELTQIDAPASGSEEDHQHETGSKVKTAQEDREIRLEEQALLNLLRTASLTDDGVQEAMGLYDTLTITGTAMPETQIYFLRELEELLRLSYASTGMNTLGLPRTAADYYGLDLQVFLSLCGVDTEDDTLNILCETEEGSRVLSLKECLEGGSLLALAGKAGPLEKLCLVCSDGRTISAVKRLIIGDQETPEDPGYGYHDYGSHLESRDLTFTVKVYQQGAEYLGAIKTVSFTTAELETLMKENPDRVVGGYYGTIGNTEHYQYVGAGGWLDYFEGLDLCWLLTEQCGIEALDGWAELYDRDGLLYSRINDLAYLTQAAGEPEEYYTLTVDGVKITGMTPMLATVKNGAPVLAGHTHDSDGYISYNTLNQNLEAIGVSTEVGVVKNHNGPFVACLGNRDGYYGGTEVETGNNCVTLRLYLK